MPRSYECTRSWADASQLGAINCAALIKPVTQRASRPPRNRCMQDQYGLRIAPVHTMHWLEVRFNDRGTVSGVSSFCSHRCHDYKSDDHNPVGEGTRWSRSTPFEVNGKTKKPVIRNNAETSKGKQKPSITTTFTSLYLTLLASRSRHLTSRAKHPR